MASMLATKTASRSAALARPTRATRSRRQLVCKAERQTWFIGAEAPAYLDGSLAGDFGFDPLGLGEDAGRLKWYVEAEKTNGRWAMMGVAGILGQELLGVTPKWFEAGAKEYDIPTAPLLAIEFLVLGFLELKRLQGYRETGTSGLINSFPFDPVGLNSPDNALKEIKNGRLAMISFVAHCTQALVTRTGPIEGLTKHIASPLEYNIIGNINNLPALIN